MFQDVFYLNAWEFLMLWEVKILPQPAQTETTSSKKAHQSNAGDLNLKSPALTRWNDEENEDWSKGFHVNPEAVQFYGNGNYILLYLGFANDAEGLRNTFCMQRRRGPMVPAPTSCPMPDKQRSGSKRDRLYLL